MKNTGKYLLILIILIATLGIALWQNNRTAVVPHLVSTEVPPVYELSNIYSNPKFNFSIRYPKDWAMREELDPRGTFKLIVRIYSPETYSVLVACEKMYPKESQRLNCGQAYSNFYLSLYDGFYVDYKNLDKIGKANYPNLRALPIKTVDAFEYATPGNSAIVNYHVNFPDKKFGIDISEENSSGLQNLTQQMISTFTQTETSSEVSSQNHAQNLQPSLVIEESDASKQAVKNIVGIWQSTEDSKSVSIYGQDGTFQGLYDNKELITGAWKVTSSLKGTSFEDRGEGVYLIVAEPSTGPLYYSVLKSNGEILELLYLPRGNTLSYKREQ